MYTVSKWILFNIDCVYVRACVPILMLLNDQDMRWNDQFYNEVDFGANALVV